MTDSILCGDAVEKLREIPDESIHLCVTSPPYDNLRTYGHGKGWDFEGTARELYRVLVPGGVVCWIVGDAVVNGSETLTSFRQVLYFVDMAGFRIHDTMIWHKKNFSSPSLNRYHQCFEYIFILSKRSPRCFNPIKDKPNSTAGRVGSLGVNTFMKRDGSRLTRAKYITETNGMRHNVWEGPTRGQEEMCETMPHPAMMPKWLARDLIISWSNEDDVVIDPFAGSGTVLRQAKKLHRHYIGIDISEEYCALMLPKIPLFAVND